MWLFAGWLRIEHAFCWFWATCCRFKRESTVDHRIIDPVRFLRGSVQSVSNRD